MTTATARGAIPDPILAALLEEAATAQGAAQAAQGRVLAYLAECGRLPGADANLAPAWPVTGTDPDLLTTAQAAHRAGRSVDTINRWCRERGIGKRYGARWRVSARRLDDEIQ